MQTSGAEMPRKERTGFFTFRTRQSFYVSKRSFQNSLPFLFSIFCFDNRPRFLIFEQNRRHDLKTCFRLFSCQISNKNEKAVTLKKSLSRTFALPLLKLFRIANRLQFRFILMFRERKLAAPAFLKFFFLTVFAAESRLIIRFLKIIPTQ